MSFFGNSAINRVNLHYAIQAIAAGAGGVFVLAFLLKAGVSVPVTLLAQAGMIAGRFVLRPIVPPLAARFGLKPLLIAAILLEAAAYPILSFVKGPDLILLIWCVVAALGSVPLRDALGVIAMAAYMHLTRQRWADGVPEVAR